MIIPHLNFGLFFAFSILSLYLIYLSIVPMTLGMLENIILSYSDLIAEMTPMDFEI